MSDDARGCGRNRPSPSRFVARTRPVPALLARHQPGCRMSARNLALVSAVLVLSGPALAQTPPGEIKGQDVMGDKSRSTEDGYVQAPIPRETSPAKDAPNPGGTSTQQNANRPVPDAPTTYAPGTDPQAPLPHRTPGPAGQNPAAPSR
jgi:hypothetical protein